MPDLVDEVEVELMNEGEQLPLPPRRSTSPEKTSAKSSQQKKLGIELAPGPNARIGSNASSRVTSASSVASDSSRRRAHGAPYSAPSSQQTETAGPHPWTKTDWMNLERCLIYERKVVASRLGLASSKDVPPDHVDVDLVLERFKGFLNLSKQVRTGPEWDR